MPLPSPNTMLCQLSLHEKQCKRIQNNISRILFYQNMCHWMVHLKRFSGGAYLSIKHCLVIHIHQWELLKTVYCPARCVNDWPRWSETYPNIQTHSFFFLQEILAVINIMGRWQSQRHYLLWPCPRSIVFFKWWEPSMRNAMCLCVLALP